MFSPRSEKKPFWCWYCGKRNKSKCGLAWSVLLSITIQVITVVKISGGVTRLRVLSPQNFDHCDNAYLSIREQTTLNHIRFVNLTPKAEQHDFGMRGNADADTKCEKTRAADSRIGGNQKRTPLENCLSCIKWTNRRGKALWRTLTNNAWFILMHQCQRWF